jgi:ATP-dependent helicase/nuclease subunit B
MDNATTILPTSRAIRAEILQCKDQDTFLPRYLSMGEFLQRVLLVEGYSRVDEDTRTLLLLEASDFSNFKDLQIERNFFTFTQNSSYLFRFFEELSGELIDIGSLEMADTYGDYEEHIEILKELHRRYETLCDAKKVLDPIFLPKRYQLNVPYVRSLGSVTLAAEGYITNFEMKILQECAAIVPFQLRFQANRFNKKMQEKLRAHGIDVVDESSQLIDLATRSVLSSERVASDAQIVCERFGERLLQVAFIKQKVYAFVKEGIAPEKIAVVLPDEGFAEHLRRFDTENNFNFAMGSAMDDSPFVIKLNAVMEYLDNQSMQNSSRLNRLGASMFEALSPLYHSAVDTAGFRALMAPFIEEEKRASAREIIEEELFYFEKILPALGSASLKSALHLFVNRLRKRSLDDVRGGKITVMGVLETRSVTYDGVIVVDFNENTVPRRSEKDLFLNSSTRIKAGLPGAQDRESLQKLYYHNLFQRAKKVAISYVESADAVPSRFLTQLGIQTLRGHEDTQWADLLFSKEARVKATESGIEADYDFTKRPLSSTGLKTFLTCRRKFYHRYAEGLKRHEIAQDMPEEHKIGTALHDALSRVYEQQSRFTEKEALRNALAKALGDCSGATVLEKYLQKLWLKRLDPFFDAEIARFKEAEVLACEKELSTEVCGVTLTGRLDRIDRTLEGLEVLDYKSGKFPIYTARTVEKATDFQLEFYHLLARQVGEVKSCGYYDLKTGKIEREGLLETKLQLLYDHLRFLRETPRFDFHKTDDLAACRFCEYAHLCKREL